MDMVGEMLVDHISREHADSVQASRLCPKFVKLFSYAPSSLARVGFNADRLLNRLWYYPRLLRACREQFEVFHIVDHTYAQLVKELPAERTIVTCHDLDAFRSLIEPELEPRPRIFKAVAQRILDGLRSAQRVVCDSNAVRDEILAHRLLAPERLIVVPNGVHPACSALPDARADAEAERLLGPAQGDAPCLLHVGTTVARKRIDLLLQIFTDLRRNFPSARLVRVGGDFTPEQSELVGRLGLGDSVRVLPFVSRAVLAAVYRRAAMLMLTSEREGFGLPMVEAMACGVPVVASDIPVLREVGRGAAAYCAVGDLSAWSATISHLLAERAERPEDWQHRRASGLSRASSFSWAEHTNRLVSLYRELVS